MSTVLYWIALVFVKVLQSLPLIVVARAGRCVGGLVYFLDARHRRVAIKNLEQCFGREKSPAEIRALAREHFRRLGENYASAIKSASMTDEEVKAHFEVVGAEKLNIKGSVAAIGHFGNFELYARVGAFVPGLQGATTYRGLRQPKLNALLLRLRRQSSCLYFERRTEVRELSRALSGGGIVLGLLCDQHPGTHGVPAPFFGFDCTTSSAPALYAQRYGMPIFPGICVRTALGRWRVEFGDEIPTHDNGVRRSAEDIMKDVNAVIEAAVRRDPPNWFWVHDRWRFSRKPQLQETPDPASLG